MRRYFTKTRIAFLLILLGGLFLRLYRLSDYLQFLGDEGRDVLIVKRMIVDHQWTLLGPSASVGGFYIGPIYYYFMLPFLWLSNLDPVGPAVMTALFGLGAIILSYTLTKRLIGQRAALIAALLITISPKMVEISRFSWNPNPMPFFALLTGLLVYFSTRKFQKSFIFAAGVSVGIMLQLHYIDLIFLPILYLWIFLLSKKGNLLFSFFLATLGIVLGDSLFLLFELRHNFPNLRSVWEFVTRGGKTVAPRSLNPFWLFDDVTRRLYEAVLGVSGVPVRIFYYSSVGAFFLWIVKGWQDEKARQKIFLLLTWFIVGIFGVGFYKGQLLPHYFGFLFPLPFIFLGILSDFLLKKKLYWPIFLIGLVTLAYFEVSSLYLWGKPNHLVEQTKNLDQIVLKMAADQPYNLALLTPGNSDQAYRYFLEIWNMPPTTILNPDVDPKRTSVTGQLIVICEDPNCKPLGNPLWEVAGFGRAEIVGQSAGPADIKVYKLVHYVEGQKL